MVGGGIASRAAAYGFSNRDRMELIRLLALSEHAAGTRRIDEMFVQRRSASAGTMIPRTSLHARRKTSGGSTDSEHAAV